MSPSDPRPCTFGFVLLDGYSLAALTAALEPLREANQAAGRPLYAWHVLGDDGAASEEGLRLVNDGSLAGAPALDALILCGGRQVPRAHRPEFIQDLQRRARQARLMGALGAGYAALAEAGLLDDFSCASPAAPVRFPRVSFLARPWVLDRQRGTAVDGDGAAALLRHWVARDQGQADGAPWSGLPAVEPAGHLPGLYPPKLQEIVALMEANLEEPLELDALARYVEVSRRQLERLFQKYLQGSPSRHYLRLRLMRARQLLRQTTLPILEIATDCGFVSTPHFSKCYRECFGRSPRDERTGSNVFALPASTDERVRASVRSGRGWAGVRA
ncbi:GlxA family transcriptional regulator [Pseudomonas mangiferae]|uniref:Helix-turn-helix domain-containing protein n=1 Tax=Pseudomonas mangiferae TaxID=2593654 RepID=A0A553GX37_9PSED|nr:helix-turn-helix domain-containing protein [Pseudomonas mangiferae]TRX74067.1 helix-turn-helix domain-containing protein [Pseudomonas mangiferae]